MSTGVNSTYSPPVKQDSGENNGPVVTAVTLWFLVISSVFIVLRCVSRIGVVKKWSWDDTFIVFAWALAFGFSFSIFWGVKLGLGLHEQFIAPENELSLRKAEYAFSVLYNPVLMATKTSILIFYLSLSRSERVFRLATISTLVVVNTAGLALTLLNVLQCHPLWAVFQDIIPVYAICTDVVTLYLSSAPVNIITDLSILFLPMPILTAMRLPRKQKIILIITFSFGAFSAAVDVVRIAYLQEAFQVRIDEVGAQNATSSRVLEQDDFSWYASLSFMWSAIEVHVGIICACVPSLKPLVARILPSMLRDVNNPNDNSEMRQGSGTEDVRFQTPDFVTVPENLEVLPGSTGAPFAKSERKESIEHSPTRRSIPASPGRGSAPEMSMIDFLETTDGRPSDARRPTRTTMGTGSVATTRRASTAFFDFYTLRTKKPMTKLSNRESYGPLALVTILFFMWGFAYGLLDVLNTQFQEVVNMSAGQAVGLHAAYYGGYFIGPPTVGRVVFKKYGFKATFITGLCIYGIGTLVFWPSAVLLSYGAFIVSNLIVGFGVSTLEVAANPFIALCGPPRHAETRLSISQGVQAIGTIIAPLLAKKVLFKDVINASALIDVQWTYLGIALFDVVLSVIFVYMPLPEASDRDFERVAEKRSNVNSAPLFGNVKVVYITLALGVMSNFFYCAAQETASVEYQSYISLVLPNASIDTFLYQTVGHTVFAASRFFCAGLHIFLKPRTVLLLLMLGMLITSILCMSLSGPSGVAMIILYEFFQGGVFPIVFALTLRGLGRHTKDGAVLLTTAISGGAVFPVIMWPVANARGYAYSFCVAIAATAAALLFPIYLLLVPKAQRQVDPVVDGHDGGDLDRRNAILPTTNKGDDGPWSQANKMLHVFSKKRKSSGPVVEHVESRRRKASR